MPRRTQNSGLLFTGQSARQKSPQLLLSTLVGPPAYSGVMVPTTPLLLALTLPFLPYLAPPFRVTVMGTNP